MALLIGLLPVGCSSDNQNFVRTGSTAPPPALTVTPNNASAVASGVGMLAMTEAVLPDSTLGISARAGEVGSLPFVQANSPNSTAMALALAALANGDGLITSPLGGTLKIEVASGGHRAVFTGLRTIEGTLDGVVRYQVTSGSPESGNYMAQVGFEALAFKTPDVTWFYDGDGLVEVSRAGDAFAVTWTSNLTIADQTHGASVAYSGFVTKNSMTHAGNKVACQSTYNGNLTFANINGQTGALSVKTTAPFSFAGELKNNAAALVVTSGALTVNDQQMAFKVVGPDAVTISAQGGAAAPYSWPFLDGPARMGFALRPTVADTILREGSFLTINANAPRAQALAILDGRILAVGTEADVARFQGDVTETVSLDGGVCLPGFVEPHMHISLTALTLLSDVNPRVVACGTQELGYTIDQALTTLKTAVNQVPDAGAIFGFNFDPSRLAPSDLMKSLTLADLDGVSQTIPVVVQNASLHISYANSAAFRATGIWPTAPNGPYTPPDDDTAQFIVVDPITKLPTGQLNEFSQNAFVQMAINRIVDTPVAKAQYVAQWRRLMDLLAAQGVTTMSDQLTGAALGLGPELDLLNLLALDPTNPVRLRSYFDSSIFIKNSVTDLGNLNIFPGEGYDRLKVIGTKFVLDGSTQGLTAGLNFNYIFPGPFPVAPDGLMDFVSAAAVLSQAQPFYDKGFQMCFHANGDKAQDQLFMVVDAMRTSNPRPDPRTRLEHFTVHQPSSLAAEVARARELDLHVSVTIGHVFFWGQVFSQTLLGADIADEIDPIRSLIEAGVITSTHSDSPVVTCDPLRNVEIASTRLWQAVPQQVLGIDETVSVEEALKTITISAAHSLFLEKQVGSLEVGKLADLAVLNQDPTTVAPDKIDEIGVLRTYLAGKALFVAP